MRLSALILVSGLAASATAAQSNVYIAVSGLGERIAMDGGKILPGSASGSSSNGGWIADATKRPCYVSAAFTIPLMRWTEVAFTFTPSGSGKVSLILAGPWRLKPGETMFIHTIPVTYDDVRVEGATLVNGSFETASTVKGQFAQGWHHILRNEFPRMITDPLAVRNGARAVEVWHNAPMEQPLTVSSGTTVTVRAWAWSSYPIEP